MRCLTVLYDANCRVCRQARGWLEEKPKFVALRFVPAGSPEAARLFPELDPEETLRQITLVGDDGSVYRGAKAWVMCLWATERYRHLAGKLASPKLMPRAERFVARVSAERWRWSEPPRAR